MKDFLDIKKEFEVFQLFWEDVEMILSKVKAIFQLATLDRDYIAWCDDRKLSKINKNRA